MIPCDDDDFDDEADADVEIVCEECNGRGRDIMGWECDGCDGTGVQIY